MRDGARLARVGRTLLSAAFDSICVLPTLGPFATPAASKRVQEFDPERLALFRIPQT
jgi:hypothetical protein